MRLKFFFRFSSVLLRGLMPFLALGPVLGGSQGYLSVGGSVYRTMRRQCAHLMLTPLRLVYMRVATFMAASSWNISLAAYGMMICAISVLFLHGLHSNWFFLRELKVC